MLRHRSLTSVFAVLALAVSSLPLRAAPDSASTLLSHPQAEPFVQSMIAAHGFQRSELQSLFASAALRPSVIERMTKPAEAKPWHQYRRLFISDARIQSGASFWRQNAAALQRASSKYGVPEEIIVAILGVETHYGRHLGQDPVLEALATLAFDYPPRAAFFRSELEQFLLLAREEQFDPRHTQGSYAGAMGLPQFISSSYRRLAVDFDGDQRRDLFASPADAIGSIAHYLKVHGWQRGQSVAIPATVEGQTYQTLLARGLKPSIAFTELSSFGITPLQPAAGGRVALTEFEGDKGNEIWLAFDNFYAITRYNHSPLYALAVYQLANAIRTRNDPPRG